MPSSSAASWMHSGARFCEAVLALEFSGPGQTGTRCRSLASAIPWASRSECRLAKRPLASATLAPRIQNSRGLDTHTVAIRHFYIFQCGIFQTNSICARQTSFVGVTAMPARARSGPGIHIRDSIYAFDCMDLYHSAAQNGRQQETSLPTHRPTTMSQPHSAAAPA